MLTADERYRRAVERGKATAAARKDSGEFIGGHYREPKRGEFYCRECDIELQTADGFAHHFEIRHTER